jgi:hypothetical protein
MSPSFSAAPNHRLLPSPATPELSLNTICPAAAVGGHVAIGRDRHARGPYRRGRSGRCRRGPWGRRSLICWQVAASLQVPALHRLAAAVAALSTQLWNSSGQAVQEPPQSTSVSSPLRIASSHAEVLHAAVQASRSDMLASSQSSTPACTKPSPQVASLQPTRQASVSSALASSQASVSAWTKPSPQTASLQLLMHASVSSGLPSSHSSPVWILASPHEAGPQALVQSSSSSWLPSSQLSPGPVTPSPQTARVQALVQASPSLSLASSHCSSPSTLPSPQTAGAGPVLDSSPVVGGGVDGAGGGVDGLGGRGVAGGPGGGGGERGRLVDRRGHGDRGGRHRRGGGGGGPAIVTASREYKSAGPYPVPMPTQLHPAMLGKIGGPVNLLADAGAQQRARRWRQRGPRTVAVMGS